MTQKTAIDACKVSQILAEIQSGEGLSLSAVGRRFPGHRGGKSVDSSTVFRWITKGIHSPNGHRVKLEGIRVGGRWLTSVTALARFVSQLSDSTRQTHPDVTTEKQTSRQQAAQNAAAALRSMGA